MIDNLATIRLSRCVCPTIHGFLMTWNDDLPDDERQILKVFVPLVVGTNKGNSLAVKRSFAVADWYIRTCLPTWLRLTPWLVEIADAITALPEIVDVQTFDQAKDLVMEAQGNAYAAWGGILSLDYCGHASWEGAVLDAAWAPVSWDATTLEAAGDAVVFASAAAWNAICLDTATYTSDRGTVLAAAREALRPTKEHLQSSVMELVHRLIAMTDGEGA